MILVPVAPAAPVGELTLAMGEPRSPVERYEHDDDDDDEHHEKHEEDDDDD